MSEGGVAPAPGLAPRRWARPRRRLVLGGAAAGLLLVLAVAAGLAASRYLPALDEARALRTDLETMVDRVRAAGLGIDPAGIDALDADLVAARERFDRLERLLADDPLVALARALPPTAANVRGADDVVAAAGNLLDAVGEGLAIGRRFVDIREARTADAAGAAVLPQLVELMATTRDRAVAAAASVERARQILDSVPDGLLGQIESIRDAMTSRIDTYGPLVDTYLEASARLPAIMGWDGPRRYLILTQDPAELRPTGGFIGSYGTIAFDRGRITERRFGDVVPLDVPWDYPHIVPPQELADYLLGPTQPWQFADANWSPDFPTSARDALRLYSNESDDTNIDGVIGITTYTIDELLKTTGPIDMPDYGVTIASGETTLKVLQMTRSAPRGEDRKAFLGSFANLLFDALFSLPAESWGELLESGDALREAHLLLAWFPDPADQALVVRAGLDGGVRQDPGDYVYAVDANVAPATKLNMWTSRAMDLAVSIDDTGNAHNTLEVAWSNDVETPAGAPYREMENVGGRILGMYFRLLVPERSRVESVSGGTLVPVTGPAAIAVEAGRTVIGTYLMVPPGTTVLRHAWTSPYAADAGPAGGSYRLTIQAQPGLLPGPIRLSIRVPDGYRITAASPELIVNGTVATLSTTFDRDLVIGLQYAP